MKIDWEMREPRAGMNGAWDRFVGPGASPAEEWVQLVLGAAIGGLCLLLFGLAGGYGRGWLVAILVIVLALDLGGGIATNATAAAKRWYHRPGHGARGHLAFVAVHGIHIALVAALAGAGPMYFAAASGATLLAAAAIVLTPLYLKRPVAFGLTTIGVLLAQLPLFDLVQFAWFLPLLWIKLLLAHLVPEAPFARHQEAAP